MAAAWDDPAGIAEAFIGSVLDDLDAGRVDVEEALRLVASAAWEAGVRNGRDRG